ncbi:MAG TPA: HAMP domain-containing protein, partial [Solirubrobacteraceae bacterium]|nr:HAMP domain-containing protein [Solirubrobacteraceae bacterium]
MSKTAAVAGRADSGTNGAATRTGAEDEVLRRLEAALRAAAAGDFSHRLPARRKGVVGELEAAYNQLAER